MTLQDELEALDRIADNHRPALSVAPSPALRAELERAERDAILFGWQPGARSSRSQKPAHWVAPELAQFLDQAVLETSLIAELQADLKAVVGLLNNPFLRGWR